MRRIGAAPSLRCCSAPEPASPHRAEPKHCIEYPAPGITRGMGRVLTILIAASFLVWIPSTGAAAAGSPPAPPSCFVGPTTVGDTTFGTPCADVIVAPAGVETVKGGAGNDTIVAAASASCPSGCRLGVGSQTFEGGPGDDIVFGERGNDILRGGEGNDRLYGGIGDDLLEGEAGNDLLSGGFGADGIDGGTGNDYVRGDGTQDEIADSGTAADVGTLSYSTGIAPGFTRPLPTSHTGFPGAGEERGVYLDLAANLGDNGVAPDGGGVDKVEGLDFERIVGSAFSDYIAGSKGGQEIYGGGGADVLTATGGAALNGGADGDDCIGGTTVTGCESTAGNGVVTPRDGSKVSVGEMTPSGPGEAQLYLVGSTGPDEVTVAYAASPPATVTFGLSGSSFDTSASGNAGCTIEGDEATCPLAGRLGSVLIAGVGGTDALDGSALPATTSLIVLGGAGNDTLTGGEESDDTVVDGAGNDALRGLGGDDALLNNEGTDQLFGEGGNDLFLSDSICNGDLLDGGEGRDNASWAKFGEGVDARLDLKLAGRPGVGGNPQCGGGTLDTVEHFEDLEGSSSGDVFYGDAGPNQLLGHFGPDTYLSGAGGDSILANSGDFDPAISCGDDVDTAIIDRAQYGDVAGPDCENVFEAAPDNFRTPTKLTPPVTPIAPVGSLAPSPAAVDSTPPQTRIIAHPPKLSTTRRAKQRVVFGFTASERGSRFRCKLDRKPYRACTSPQAYSVRPGRHTVRIGAVDPAGNADPTPALFRFRVARR
jgi:Ca2+-binding RTX toxin-like protein